MIYVDADNGSDCPEEPPELRRPEDADVTREIPAEEVAVVGYAVPLTEQVLVEGFLAGAVDEPVLVAQWRVAVGKDVADRVSRRGFDEAQISRSTRA